MELFFFMEFEEEIYINSLKSLDIKSHTFGK